MRVYITSTGASGTKFLARVVHGYTDHLGLHEPKSLRYPEHPKMMLINGRRKQRYQKLPGTHGVILRDPRQVMLSWYNRKKARMTTKYPPALNQILLIIDQHIQTGAEVIYFEDMVGNIDLLTAWLKRLGVTVTVPIPEFIMATKVNHNGRLSAASYEDLPEEFRTTMDEVCGWYIEKYFESSQ